MRAEVLFLMQKSAKAVSDCDTAVAQIAHAKTLLEVVRAMQVHVDSLARPMPEVRAAVQRVDRAAAQQAEQLLGVQLKALAEAKGRDAFDALHGRFRREWEVLRGHLPQAYRLATGQATRLRPAFNSASR